MADDHSNMFIPRVFNGDYDAMVDALVLAQSRLMPALQWLDELHDPVNRVQLSAAVLMLIVRRTVLDGHFENADQVADLARALYASARDGHYDVERHIPD